MLASPENNLSLNLSAGTDAKNQKYEFALQTAGAGFSDSINNLKGNNAFSGYLKDFENYANIVMGKTPEFTFNPENYYINNFKNWGTENIKNSEENKNLKKSASWAVQAQQSAVNFLFNQAGSYAANFLNNLVAPKLTKYLGDLGLGTAGTQIVGTLQGTITEFIRGGIETAFSGFKANVLNTINNTSTRVPLSEIPSTKPSTIPGDTGPQKGAGEIVDDAKNEAISNAGEEVAASVKKQTSALTMQWLKVRNQAYDRLANIGATYAQKYAETIGNELIDKLDNLGDKFGGQVGSSFLQALARQVRNYVGDNLKKSVSAWLQNQLLGKNANTKWSEFKIDWTLVAAETLAGVIGNKEIAEVVDAGYRAARSMLGLVLNYEEFSELDYLFLVEDGNTGLVSSALNKMMNPKIAGLDIIKNKLKDASPLPRLISSKLFLTGAAAGLGTGGINSAFQYSPFWDSTQFYDGMMYDMSGIGYGINIRSLIYVTFGRIKLPRIKDGIFTDTATLYNSSIWQMALGSVLPVDLQRAVSGDFLGALTGFFGNIADSYILCDMRENTSAVSSVQVALSLSGQLGGVYTGIPIVSMNLPKGVEIMKEAYTFALFTVQNMAAGGFGGTIKDKTHNPVAMYNLNTGEYTIGPFKVDYNRSSVKTSRGKSEFGLMTNMRIYDQNGTPINGWNIIWEEGGKSGRDSINADDPFPNPNEDFYIRFYNYQSNNIQAISRIELEYKEMQALTQYNTLSGFYFRNCIPDPTEVKITVFYDTWTHISLGFNIPLKFIVGIGNGPDIISVNYAKKYYINHTQTITLTRKQNKNNSNLPAGYDTAEFSTSSSVKKTGMTNVSTAYGDPANSSMYQTLEGITASGGPNMVSVGSTSKIKAALEAVDAIFNQARARIESDGTVTYDENGNKIVTYNDGRGKVLYTRRSDGTYDFTAVVPGLDTTLRAFSQIARVYGQNQWADYIDIAANFADGKVSLVSKVESVAKRLYPEQSWVKYVGFAAAINDMDGKTSSTIRLLCSALRTFDLDQKFGDCAEYVNILEDAAAGLARENLTKAQEQEALNNAKNIIEKLIKFRTDNAGLALTSPDQYLSNYNEFQRKIYNELNVSAPKVKVGTMALVNTLAGRLDISIQDKRVDVIIKAFQILGKTGGTNKEKEDALKQVAVTIGGETAQQAVNVINKAEQGVEQIQKVSDNINGSSSVLNGLTNIESLLNNYGVIIPYQGNLNDTVKALETKDLRDAFTAIKNIPNVNQGTLDAVTEMDNIITRSEKSENKQLTKDDIDNLKRIVDSVKKTAKVKNTGIQIAALQNVDLNLGAGQTQEEIEKTAQRLASYIESNPDAQRIWDGIDDVLETESPFEATQKMFDLAGAESDYQAVAVAITALTNDFTTENKMKLIGLLQEVSRRAQENGGNVANATETVIDYGITKQPVRDMMNTMQGLTRNELNSLIQELQGVSTFSQMKTLFDSYEAKKLTRQISPDETNYFDTQTAGVGRNLINAYLEDSTPYIEYNSKFNMNYEEGKPNVYWQHYDEGGITISVAGVVWKDAHWGLENDNDGIRNANANGEMEAGIQGVKVTVINHATGEVAQKYGERGERLEATTYTDAGGYYSIERIRLSEVLGSSYDVEFEYDGQKYKTTKYLAGYGETDDVNKKLNDYVKDPDAEKYFNDSKAVEDETERQEFNDRYYEITEGYAISFDRAENTKVPCKNGTARYTYKPATATNRSQAFNYEITADGRLKTPLSYTKIDGKSELNTLDEEGHVLPQYAMHARTSNLSLTYPLYDLIMLDDSQQDINSGTAKNKDMQVHFEGEKPATAYSSGKYMYHINLGLIERSKSDLAVTQDVYTATTTVNEKQETYNYDEREILNIYNTLLKQTDKYHDWSYTRELYKADYDFRKADYRMNSLNRFDRYGNDKTTEIANIVRVKNDVMDDISERLFVTYKIKIINQSILQWATVNELADYYDKDYTFIGNEFTDSNGVANTEGVKMYIQDEEGNRYNKLVIPKSYYEVYQTDTNNVIKREQINWYEGVARYSNEGFKTIYTRDLSDVILEEGQEIAVYVTFEVNKQNGALIRDEIDGNKVSNGKRNIAEITNYSNCAKGSVAKWMQIEGLIDKDSAPGHSNPRNIDKNYEDKYEDSVDEAPALYVKLYDTDKGTRDGRIIEGYVWDDARSKLISQTGQEVGNGLRELNLRKVTDAKNKNMLKGEALEDGENIINGVKVQLVEKIVDPSTGEEYEYVWKQAYTSEDVYEYVQNGGAGNAGSIVKGNISENKENGNDYEYNVVNPGQYRFNNFVAGNYIVRFIYGDDERTYLTNAEDSTVDKTLTEGNNGKNKVSYNGQDYKSTTYQLGRNINKKWYDLSDYNQMEKLMSDAKDDETRRKIVMDYSRTIENDKAEILASFDARMDRNAFDDNPGDTRNYYNESKHKDLRNNTWMFADTAWINAQVEYNKTVDNGIVVPEYRIKNIDFGLEQRPETKIELDMKIDSLIVKDSSKNVIIDVKGGISKNILMIDQQKNPIDGYSYKRKTMKYGYNQGKYQIYMDNEILNGATIEIKYLITITNNSEVDTLGSDGSLGTAYYQGIYSPNDVIVTTQIDKIIDYIDNSSTFVKENSIEWSLVENMDEFLTDDIKAQVQITGEVQTETDKRNKETYLNNLRSALGTNFVNENIALYEKQYREEQINKSTAWSTIDNDNNKGIRNQEILKHMQNMGYLDKTLEFVQTKSGRTVNQGITQTAVTEILDTEQDKMIPSSTKLYSEYEVSVRSKKAVVLTLSKTLSPNDETDSYDYRNVAEILQYTNDAGRRDMDAVPGNQDPNVTESMSWFLGGKKEVMPYEYDSDLAERIFITPPTGENRNYVLYTIVAGISLIVIAGVVIIVRKKIMHK